MSFNAGQPWQNAGISRPPRLTPGLFGKPRRLGAPLVSLNL